MKTIDELEALVETVTRERDLSLFAWESAGMTGRDAQSAMLELARKLEEACEMVELQNARLDQHHGAEIRMERERDEARETIVALTTAKAEADLEIATLTAALDERDLEAERGLEQYDRLVRERDEARAEVDRLTDERDELLVRVANQDAELRAARAAYRKVHAELKRERIDLPPVDEVRCDAYRRGAEAMREACARVADAHCVPGTRDVIRALPIPEEP